MQPDAVCLGEALIDLFAPVGIALKDADVFHRVPGGAPANVAVGLAKLGTRAGFIGKVGDDPFGWYLADTLARAGVDTGCLRFSEFARTTLAWVARPDPDHPEFLFYRNPGADALLGWDDIDLVYVTGARLLHFGSVSLSLEPARSTTLRVVEEARQAGVIVSYDPNWRPHLWPDLSEARRLLRDGLARAHVVKLNREELELLTGACDVAAGARVLLARGAELVIVTMGERGAHFANGRSSGFVEPFPVEVVDATGCGDAFMAATICGLLRARRSPSQIGAEELGEILRFASAAAALTARRRGVMPALPTRAQVEAFLHAACNGAVTRNPKEAIAVD